jgi:hypothetical protein
MLGFLGAENSFLALMAPYSLVGLHKYFEGTASNELA